MELNQPDYKQLWEDEKQKTRKLEEAIDDLLNDRRAELAKAAMQGLCSYHGYRDISHALMASCAREYADALIAELDKEGKA